MHVLKFPKRLILPNFALSWKIVKLKYEHVLLSVGVCSIFDIQTLTSAEAMKAKNLEFSYKQP